VRIAYPSGLLYDPNMEEHDLCALWFGNNRVKRFVSSMASVKSTEKNGEWKNELKIHKPKATTRQARLKCPKKGVDP
jgi:hypothetical protein